VTERDQSCHADDAENEPVTQTSTPTIAGAGYDLTNRADLRALLRRHGLLHTNKGLGQHLLVDRAALDAIIAAADLTADDLVLEVGAGPGTLTLELAQRAQRVVAVELDRAILPVLRETTAPFTNVEILHADLLTVEPATLFGADAYKLVANLPYYITALTLRHFFEAENPPRLLVVMVQREVAERMTAAPGAMSLLSISVQFYGSPRIVADVPAGAFFPPPKVDSSVVRVEVNSGPLLTGAARTRFFALAHGGFSEKRKQIHNSLARYMRCDPAVVARWLAAAEIAPTRRAQTLSMEEWLRLTRASLAETPTLAPADPATPLKPSRRAQRASQATAEDVIDTTEQI